MSDLFHARGAPAPSAGRLFALCVALSIALHAAALAFVALHPRSDAAVADPVLSVELAPAEIQKPALPVSVAELSAREPPEGRKPVVAVTTRAKPAPAAPPLALVETRAAPEPSVPAPAAPVRSVETPASAAAAPPRSEPMATAAAESTAPPSFNAAYLNNPRPVYPQQARRNGEQGTVLLKVLVTREGLPGRVELDKTSGSVLLDGAALEAVKIWRFVPARRGSEAVEEWVRVPIVFRLVDAS